MRGEITKLSLSCTAFLFLCMLACVEGVASARTIYVPDDYAKIQWAVDNATAGDTIIVRDGIYHENVNVNKPHLTIKSENGSANCIVQAKKMEYSTFTITSNNVSIVGFTICGGGDYPVVLAAGIEVSRSSHIIIRNNIVEDNFCGIFLEDSNCVEIC